MSAPVILESLRVAEATHPKEVTLDQHVSVLQSETATPVDQENAFAGIVTAMQGPLTAYVTRRLGSNDAEDVVQSVFLKAYCAMGRFENNGEAALISWFYKITHNLVVNTVRDGKTNTLAQAVGKGLEEPIAASSRTSRIGEPEAHLEFVQTLALLGEIPERQRTAMIKKAAGYSQKEIASTEDTTIPAVKSLLIRGRANADQLLVEAGFSEAPGEEAQEAV